MQRFSLLSGQLCCWTRPRFSPPPPVSKGKKSPGFGGFDGLCPVLWNSAKKGTWRARWFVYLGGGSAYLD